MNSSFRIDLSFRPFLAEYKAALKKFPTFKNDMKSCLSDLENDPKIGDRIPRCAPDLYKVRIGVKNQFGKRGGYG